MEDKDENVFEGAGVIIQKSEALTKKGDKYFKFSIEAGENTKTYNLFDYEAGTKVSVGDTVRMFWTEKTGSFNNMPVTYRNLNAIYREEAEEEEIKDIPAAKPETPPTPEPKKDMGAVEKFKIEKADEFEIQRSQRQAMEVICAIAMSHTQVENAKEYVKTAIIDHYEKLSIQLFKINKKIRLQILGY